MSGTWQDAERDLAEHKAEYEASEFVPFPTADAAVEAVLETMGWTFSSFMSEGEEFVLEVARRLNKAIEDKREEFLQSYWTQPADTPTGGLTVPAEAVDDAS